MAQRGLTLEKVGELSHPQLSWATVQRIASGRHIPKKKSIAALASGLDVPEARLLLDPDQVIKPTLAEALAVVRDELGIEITPVHTKADIPADIPADIAKEFPTLPSSAWDAIRAIIVGVKLNK